MRWILALALPIVAVVFCSPALAETSQEGEPASEAPPLEAATGRAAVYGGMVGLASGMLLLFPILDEGQGCEDECTSNGPSVPDAFLPSVLLGTSIGAFGGYYLAKHTKATAGQVTFTTTLGLAGLGTSELIYVSIVGGGDDGGKWNSIAVGLGLNAGLGAGAYFASGMEWSVWRAYIVAASGVLGTWAGHEFADRMGIDFDHEAGTQSTASHLSALGGMWLGIGSSILLTRNMQPDSRFADRNGTSALHITPMASPEVRGLMLGGNF